MSATAKFDSHDEDRLEKLYELRDELQTIADSDAEWARYAQEGLDQLREAGYDV